MARLAHRAEGDFRFAEGNFKMSVVGAQGFVEIGLDEPRVYPVLNNHGREVGTIFPKVPEDRATMDATFKAARLSDHILVAPGHKITVINGPGPQGQRAGFKVFGVPAPWRVGSGNVIVLDDINRPVYYLAGHGAYEPYIPPARGDPPPLSLDKPLPVGQYGATLDTPYGKVQVGGAELARIVCSREHFLKSMAETLPNGNKRALFLVVCQSGAGSIDTGFSLADDVASYLRYDEGIRNDIYAPVTIPTSRLYRFGQPQAVSGISFGQSGERHDTRKILVCYRYGGPPAEVKLPKKMTEFTVWPPAEILQPTDG